MEFPRELESSRMRVLAITCPALRADALGCYGNDQVLSPGLDELAARSVVFDRHYATIPEALDAWQAWTTKKAPRPPGETLPISESDDLLLRLHHQSVDLRLFMNSDRPLAPSIAGLWPAVSSYSSLGELKKKLAPVLKPSTQQQLIWIDLPHLIPPWSVPKKYLAPYFQGTSGSDEISDGSFEEVDAGIEPWLNPPQGKIQDSDIAGLQRLRFSYLSAVSHLDNCVGHILEWVDKSPDAEQWTIVFTSPHGWSLGEHGIIDPAFPWIHDERLHVPLMVRLPKDREAGRRVAALTHEADLAGAWPDMLGVSWSDWPMPGLWPLAGGRTDSIHSHLVSAWRMGDEIEYAVRNPEWKLIVPGDDASASRPRQRQLYVKPFDRFEVNNVIQHYPEKVEELEALLRAHPLAARYSRRI